MASGNIQGKVNIGLFKYRGVDTDTAKTNVDNVSRTISVDVDTDEVVRRTVHEIQPEFDAKQDKLVSGENIKTVNGNSILGAGDIEINGGVWGNITGRLSDQTDLQSALDEKQEELVSGENIKTINGESILGEGDIELSVNPIEKVESLEDVPDNDLGLYKYNEVDEETGNNISSHIVEVVKEDHPGGETSYEKTTTSNNTSLNESTFMNQFDSELSNFIAINSLTNVYSLYYSTMEVPFNGIRIGTKNVGTLELNILQECDIVIYKYFSYNSSTGVKTYDTNAEFIIDNEQTYTFEDDETPVVVHLESGVHTIASGGQNKRIILTAFEINGEPYSTYDKKELARVEEVEKVQENLDTHINESKIRFTTDETLIQNNTNNIEQTNNKIGPVQIYSVKTRLPQPTEEFLDKIYRFNEEYYQCVKRGEGENKIFNFNVSGSTEINIDNYSIFMQEIDDNFDEYFEIPTNEIQHEDPETGEIITETVLEANKLFRNNGTIRVGSSSYTGYVKFQNITDLPITSLKIGVKAYNANKPSHLYIETSDDSGDYYFNYLLEDNVNETLIDLTTLTQSNNLYSVWLESRETYVDESEDEPVTINCDKRVVITRILAEFGAVSYEWIPLIPESGGLRYGYYYLNDVATKWLYGGESGELIPEDYQGQVIEFVEGGIFVATYESGSETNYVWISGSGYVEVSGDDDTTAITAQGIDKINPSALVGLTHSFNELDSTLKAIVDSAIGTHGIGAACTEQQWAGIKQLLDKSLYLNYEGVSLIKGASDGIETYMFGCRGVNYGYTIEMYYNSVESKLYVYYEEV